MQRAFPAFQSEAAACIADVLKAADLDDDGMISRGELAVFLRSTDSGFWTNKRLDACFNMCDADGDGSIVIDEFISWLFQADAWESLPDASVFQEALERLPEVKKAKLSRQREAVEMAFAAITRDDVSELRKSPSPPKSIVCLCQATIHLLIGRLKEPVRWVDVQKYMGSDFIMRLQMLPPEIESFKVPQFRFDVARAVLDESEDGRRNFAEFYASQSDAANRLCMWMHEVLKYNGMVISSVDAKVAGDEHLAGGANPCAIQREWSLTGFRDDEELVRSAHHRFSQQAIMSRDLSGGFEVGKDQAMSALNERGLQELRALTTPPDGIGKVCAMAMHLLAGINSTVHVDSAGAVTDTSWTAAQCMLNPEHFLHSLEEFDARLAAFKVPVSSIMAAREIGESLPPDYCYTLMRMRIWTAAGIYLWCQSAAFMDSERDDNEDRMLRYVGLARYNDHCKFLGSKSIWGFLQDETVKLCRASWFLELNEKRRSLPKRQHMPAQAFWDPHALQAAATAFKDRFNLLPIVVISYCWLTHYHPDPYGEQVEIIARVLEMLMDRYRHFDFAVFIDWCSLYQQPRTNAMQAAFIRGLRHINILYAHQLTIKWLLTELPDSCSPVSHGPRTLTYDERGWPTFERAIASMITHSRQVQNLGRLNADCTDYFRVEQACSLARLPPRSPEVFAKILAAKTFTNSTDHEVVEAIYRTTFDEVMKFATYLNFSRLHWTDSDAEDLAAVLPFCSELHCLELWGNVIGSNGAVLLAGVIPKCLQLEELHIQDNRITMEGLAQLRQAWKQAGKDLMRLWYLPQKDEL